MTKTFVDMPVDIGVMVLNNWIAENQKMHTLSNVDVAFCNKALRPIWLEIVSNVSTSSLMGNFNLSSPTSCIPQLEWILSRRAKLSNLHIDVREFSNFVQTAGNRTIPSLLSLSLYGFGRRKPDRVLFKRFLELFPSLVFIDVRPWLSITADEYTVLVEVAGLNLQEIILENCDISPEAVAKVVRHLGAELRKFDGSMLDNVDNSVMEALRLHCPRLQHIAMGVEGKSDLASLLTLLHEGADHIQDVTVHFAGSTSLAQDFGDFVYEVTHTIRQLTCLRFGDAIITHPHDALCKSLAEHRELVEYHGGGQSYRRSDEACRFRWQAPASERDFLAIFSAMADCSFPVEELVIDQISSTYSCWSQGAESSLQPAMAHFLQLHGKSIRCCKLCFAALFEDSVDDTEEALEYSTIDLESSLLYFPVMDLISACPALQVLEVGGCRNSSARCYQSASAQLPLFPKLRRILLNDARSLSEIYVVQLIEKSPSLETVDLLDCPGLSSKSLSALREHCPRLTEIRGYNVNFSEKSMETFHAVRPHCDLKIWKSHSTYRDREVDDSEVVVIDDDDYDDVDARHNGQ